MSNVHRVQLYVGFLLLGAIGFHEHPHIPTPLLVPTLKNVDIEDNESYGVVFITVSLPENLFQCPQCPNNYTTYVTTVVNQQLQKQLLQTGELA